MWRGSRLDRWRRCMHLSQELGPLAPDTSVHCVPRPREASFDAGKDVLLGP